MTVDTNTMISITEANQNFSKVARLVDDAGSPTKSGKQFIISTFKK